MRRVEGLIGDLEEHGVQRWEKGEKGEDVLDSYDITGLIARFVTV